MTIFGFVIVSDFSNQSLSNPLNYTQYRYVFNIRLVQTIE